MSRGSLGASLGWFSPGAMVPCRGDPSVSVFCVGLPGKGSRQCRERGGTPLIPTTPQTTTTLALPPLTLSIFPICAPGVEVGAQHAAPLPPPDPTCTHTMGESGSELLGTRHPAPPSRFSQICPLLWSTILLTCDSILPPPHPLSSYAAECGDRGAQQHSTSPRFPVVPLCGLPGMVIVITADPTLLET